MSFELLAQIAAPRFCAINDSVQLTIRAPDINAARNQCAPLINVRPKSTRATDKERKNKTSQNKKQENQKRKVNLQQLFPTKKKLSTEQLGARQPGGQIGEDEAQ